MADFKQKKIRTDAEWLAAGNRDRRAKERRDGGDRREMIRFDLEQGERRNYQDRRSNANAWQNDHTF
jgi:hypothetical protein